jgi:predicted metal-dependent phosphotriesterase family hydrolase
VTAVVRTVLGDIPAERLGVTYLHEHLIIDSPLVADRFPHIHLPSVDDAVAELRLCAGAGVGAMVDAMPCAAGRDVLKLAAISRATGIQVVAVTGLHTARYYDGHPWTSREPAAVLADLLTADITEGIDRYDYTGPVIRRTEHRAGMIKVAALGVELSDAEGRLFDAAAEAHHRTGAPILTHCEGGLGGLAQVERLAELGVPLSRVVLSHTDKHADLGYHRELLTTGVNLEYDQALRQDPGEQRGTAWLLSAMLAEGYRDQLLLGTDGARRSLWRTLGGAPGLAWLAAGFSAVLESWGVDAGTRRTLLVDNPARVLGIFRS